MKVHLCDCLMVYPTHELSCTSNLDKSSTPGEFGVHIPKNARCPAKVTRGHLQYLPNIDPSRFSVRAGHDLQYRTCTVLGYPGIPIVARGTAFTLESRGVA